MEREKERCWMEKNRAELVRHKGDNKNKEKENIWAEEKDPVNETQYNDYE